MDPCHLVVQPVRSRIHLRRPCKSLPGFEYNNEMDMQNQTIAQSLKPLQLNGVTRKIGIVSEISVRRFQSCVGLIFPNTLLPPSRLQRYQDT